ncbi:MAG: carbohydrate-binding protein, partial [Chthoniobacterales bacterium]
YLIDYAQQTQEGVAHPAWEHAAWTLDPFTYPEDPRLFVKHELLNVMTFAKGGQTFLGLGGSTGVHVYRFDGNIAVPAVSISRNPSDLANWPSAKPASAQSWIWVDGSDGSAPNGQYESSEFAELTDLNGSGPSIFKPYGFRVDPDGTIRITESSGARQRLHSFLLPSTAIVGGVPQYSNGLRTEVDFADPALNLDWGPNVLGVSRIEYDPSNDSMYLVGNSADTPGGGLREVRKYTNWSSIHTGGTPAFAWRVILPWAEVGNDDNVATRKPISVDIEGDYLFVNYRRLSGGGAENIPCENLVYGLAAGDFVGYLRPTQEVGWWVGDTEMLNSINVHQRTDGTYVLFQEANDYAKILMLQWNPQGSTPDLGEQIEAEDFDFGSGVGIYPGGTGGKIGNVQAGDYVRYDGFDFGIGAKSFDIALSSNTNGGTVEVRLGSLTGELVGTASIGGTGSWNAFQVVSVNLTREVTGVEDLYLVFTGGGGSLVDVDWFKFKAEAIPG